MHVFLSSSLLAAGAGSCFLSFTWSILFFFEPPSCHTIGTRLLQVLAPASALLHVSVILKAPVGWVNLAVGEVSYLAALSLFWWAIKTNRKLPLSWAFQDDCPVHLVRSGPYRWIRHPFYTSYVLAWLAGGVGTSDWRLIMSTLVMFVIYNRAAGHEEQKFAQSGLALSYDQYRATTGRFLPRCIAPPRSKSH